MMVNSTFISIGFHVFLIIFAYYGLPSFQVKDPIELPIDIVEETQKQSRDQLGIEEKN